MIELIKVLVRALLFGWARPAFTAKSTVFLGSGSKWRRAVEGQGGISPSGLTAQPDEAVVKRRF
ncbi:MAG: hypothetical protein CL393_03240 [Acidiferrobacteraceae bacterium]|jgi:hypothetical protein|nr:hypothetical protein [Nitrospinota bacterium]MBT58530.1 hypothetical protein [Acidiferrobacteraceae bacterium]|tara:strand:- start:557 stop:748 length:192 start_codon:yes stop_codon:yes gene_type:complete